MVSILTSRAFRVCAAAILAVFLGLLAAPAFAKPAIGFTDRENRLIVLIHDTPCGWDKDLLRAQLVTPQETVEVCAGGAEGADGVTYVVLVAPASKKSPARAFAAIPLSKFAKVTEA